jgi:hypothetical protein
MRTTDAVDEKALCAEVRAICVTTLAVAKYRSYDEFDRMSCVLRRVESGEARTVGEAREAVLRTVINDRLGRNLRHQGRLLFGIDERVEGQLYDVCLQEAAAAYGRSMSTYRRAPRQKLFEAITRELTALDDDESDGAVSETPAHPDSGADIKISISSLPSPLTPGGRIFGRASQLEALDQAWSSHAIRILVVAAEGGTGKSALLDRWLVDLAQGDWGGARRVFAWSFHSQGTVERVAAGDLFLEQALEWFGDPDASRGSPWDRGRRLADLIRSRKTLLLLDGLEPLQFPPGPYEGRLRDTGLRATLLELAAKMRGLCVVTTRIGLTDLEPYAGRGVQTIDLPPLPPHAGRDLLRALGVKGPDAELEQASHDFGGHSLALVLLGSYLDDVYDGDIRRRGEVHRLTADARFGGHARRVMDSYARWFGDGPEVATLRVLGLFDRPASMRVLETLRREPIIAGLTERLAHLTRHEWSQVIANLRRSRLVVRELEDWDDTVDAHPLVREHFGEDLRAQAPEAWREANSRLFTFYTAEAEPFPDSLQGMEPLLQAIVCGCRARRYREAFHDVYLSRIMRGDENFAATALGAMSVLVYALSFFFEEGQWSQPSTALSEQDRLLVQTQAAGFLTATRGYAAPEVGECYEAAHELATNLEDHERLLEALLGLCRFTRMQSNLHASIDWALSLKDLLAVRGEAALMPLAERAQASTLFYLGKFDEVEAHSRAGDSWVDRDVAMANAFRDANEPVISCRGYLACAFWFRGYPDRAVGQAASALNDAMEFGHPHTIAILEYIYALVAQFSGHALETHLAAEKLIETCEEHGFELWHAAGRILTAWGRAMLDKDATTEELRDAIGAWQATGARLFMPYWLSMLADAHQARAEWREADRGIVRALNEIAHTGEEWWLAELLRLKGIAGREGSEVAERYIRQAVSTAARQGAKSLELRAAVDLAALPLSPELARRARAELARLYEAFDEGFTQPDLERARRLLESA